MLAPSPSKVEAWEEDQTRARKREIKQEIKKQGRRLHFSLHTSAVQANV